MSQLGKQPDERRGLSAEDALLTLLQTSDQAIQRQSPEHVEETVQLTEGLLRHAGGISTEANEPSPDTTE